MENKKIIYFITLLVTSFLSIFFLYATRIVLIDFLTININILIEKSLSLNFILFLIFYSINIILLYLIKNEFEYKDAVIISIIGFVIGSFVAILIFGLIEYLFIYIISSISIILINKSEKGIGFNKGVEIAKYFNLFFCVGLFLSLLFITLPISEELENNFSKEIFELTNPNIDINPISDSAAELSIQSQIQTLNVISNLTSFKNLENKTDSEVRQFITEFKTIQNTINSKEYEETIKENISGEEINIEDSLKEIPIIDETAKNAWILYPALAAILFLSIITLISDYFVGLICYLIKKRSLIK